MLARFAASGLAHQTWIVLLCLVMASPLLASMPTADPADDLSFHLRSWSIADGLPGNHVSAIAQDREGFLWLATMSGLVRFDGFEFRVYNERDGNLPTGRFNALDVGPSGRLWIGSDQGHLILRENGEFRVVARHFPGIPIDSIAEDRDGSVWFVQSSSLVGNKDATLLQWAGQAVVQREDIEARLLPYPRARDYNARDKPGGHMTLEKDFPQMVLARDTAGDVWARAFAGSSLRIRDGLSDPFGAGDAAVLMLGSAQLMARADSNGQVELLDTGSGSRSGLLQRETERLQGVWLRDARGLLWVSDARTLYAYRANDASPAAQWRLDTQILDLTQDSEGNIWVATRTRGLLRISPNPVRQLGVAQGVPLPAGLWPQADGSAVLSSQLLQPDGIDVADILLYRLTPGSLMPEKDGADPYLDDRAGTRWRFARDNLHGLRADGSRVVLDRYCAELYLDPIQDDILWAKSETTLMRIRVFADRPPQIEGEWPASLRSLPNFDAEGGLWIGGIEGLHHVRGMEHRVYDRGDGLPVNEVRALYRDDDGGLWLGTYGGGLAYFDGARFHTIEQRQGLVENAISSIVPDRFGALWLGGNRGIQRLLLSDLRAVVAGAAAILPVQLYDETFGLDNPESVGPYSGAAVGTRIYFATFSGLVAVDPEIEARREQSKPRVHLFTSGPGRALGDDTALVLEPDQRGIDLAYTALHLSAPETLRFRHWLQGHDADWVESGKQRQLKYDQLRPGAYQLRVQARHSGGPWVEAGVPTRIEVPPLWWETPIAWIVGGLCLLGLLAASWRLANRRIRQRALALEALVAERTAALQIERDQVARQATRLQELAEGRARFMSGISHELRTPLSLILAPLTDLGEGRHGMLPDAARAQVIGAHRNAQRLLRLVERLLEVARVEAGVQALHCLQIDLRAALAELVEQLQPLAQQRGSSLRAVLPDRSVPVWIDPLLMESVLVNLMVNALRHTDPGSQVAVELDSPHTSDAQGIALRVRDNGKGIPADALPHLFERFFRVRGEHASGSDGFGLGLPLVREVVERHGGHVNVESSPNGTCFTVQLREGRAHLADEDIASAPLAPRQQASLLSALDTEVSQVWQADSDATAELDPSSNAKLVLVADDNPELRRLLRSYLQPEFRVQEADSGASALECVSQILPDLIITDVMMPVMDGHELCRTLRASIDTDFIPLLMLTAKAGLEHRIEGLEGGADAYLGKPFDRRELMATVGALIKSQHRLRELYLGQAKALDQPPDTAQVSPAQAANGEAPVETRTERLRKRIEQLIEANLATEDFRIEDLAEGMAQSRATLHRWCKHYFDQSPGELIRTVRLQRAKEMLLRQEGSVTEVAYAVGFRSVSHFSTAFRQFSGTSPSDMRQQIRPDPSVGTQ